MKERVLSGAVLILFLAAIVLFHQSFPYALNLIIALISALAVYELIKAMSQQRRWLIVLPSLAAAVLVPLVGGKDMPVFLVYCVYTALVFGEMIRDHKNLSFQQVASIYCMVAIIPLALTTLCELRVLGGEHGMFYVLISILCAWVADAGAYFAGTFFGKHKLSPEISPKKTVEGAIGGVVINMLLMWAAGLIFCHGIYGGEKQVNYWVLLAIGFFGALFSILGDLSFSLIKRSCQIKDFGQVIPGHGGILDRFDSVIFTAPFVYILVTYLPIVVA